MKNKIFLLLLILSFESELLAEPKSKKLLPKKLSSIILTQSDDKKYFQLTENTFGIGSVYLKLTSPGNWSFKFKDRNKKGRFTALSSTVVGNNDIATSKIQLISHKLPLGTVIMNFGKNKKIFNIIIKDAQKAIAYNGKLLSEIETASPNPIFRFQDLSKKDVATVEFFPTKPGRDHLKSKFIITLADSDSGGNPLLTSSLLAFGISHLHPISQDQPYLIPIVIGGATILTTAIAGFLSHQMGEWGSGETSETADNEKKASSITTSSASSTVRVTSAQTSLSTLTKTELEIETETSLSSEQSFDDAAKNLSGSLAPGSAGGSTGSLAGHSRGGFDSSAVSAGSSTSNSANGSSSDCTDKMTEKSAAVPSGKEEKSESAISSFPQLSRSIGKQIGPTVSGLLNVIVSDRRATEPTEQKSSSSAINGATQAISLSLNDSAMVDDQVPAESLSDGLSYQEFRKTCRILIEETKIDLKEKLKDLHLDNGTYAEFFRQFALFRRGFRSKLDIPDFFRREEYEGIHRYLLRLQELINYLKFGAPRTNSRVIADIDSAEGVARHLIEQLRKQNLSSRFTMAESYDAFNAYPIPQMKPSAQLRKGHD